MLTECCKKLKGNEYTTKRNNSHTELLPPFSLLATLKGKREQILSFKSSPQVERFQILGRQLAQVVSLRRMVGESFRRVRSPLIPNELSRVNNTYIHNVWYIICFIFQTQYGLPRRLSGYLNKNSVDFY